jgi:hypothetical protein
VDIPIKQRASQGTVSNSGTFVSQNIFVWKIFVFSNRVMCFVGFRGFYIIIQMSVLVPAAARSKALVCGGSPAEITDSNPAGGMDVCCACCVLSDRGLCDELITRPEESYQLWCVVVCDLGTSRMRTPRSKVGRRTTEKKLLVHLFQAFKR